MKAMIHEPERWSPAVQGEDESLWSHWCVPPSTPVPTPRPTGLLCRRACVF